MAKTRVLLIDDSALMRQLLRDVLSTDPGIEVVGAARDPIAGWKAIQELSPDVLTLDVEMPRMDGLSFLERLMQVRPMPVLMVSSLTERGAAVTLRALELGAIDFVAKPKIDVARGTVDLADELCSKVKAAARARPRVRAGHSPGVASPPAARASVEAKAVARPSMRASASVRAPAPPAFRTTDVVVAIGASTGGTEALREVLTALPAGSPGVVVVQHMPERFTEQFAARLDGLCRVRVREARDGDLVRPGHVLIAPGGSQHLELVRSGASTSVRLVSAPAVRYHRPSVDVMFGSCARAAGANAIGVILTGMGDDGARGLLAMRTAGARTIAQDEQSCVVFGMPKEAIGLGAAEQVLPLESIAKAIVRLTQRDGRSETSERPSPRPC